MRETQKIAVYCLVPAVIGVAALALFFPGLPIWLDLIVGLIVWGLFTSWSIRFEADRRLVDRDVLPRDRR